MTTLLNFRVLKSVGVPQPKNMHRFLPNFQAVCTPRGSRGGKVLGVSDNNCCRGNTLNFWILKFVGVPQPKLMHRFSPNFQDMLTKRGSRAD